MKATTILAAAMGFTLVMGNTGCESAHTRLKEREAQAIGWSPITKERLTRGEIKVGDTFDMVFVALGTPGAQETFTVEDGTTATIWSYPEIKQQYEGEATVGYEDVSEYNIQTGERIHYQIPNRQKVYRTEKEKGLQVIFRRGLVTSVRWQSTRPPPPAESEQ